MIYRSKKVSRSTFLTESGIREFPEVYFDRKHHSGASRSVFLPENDIRDFPEILFLEER